MANAIPHIPAPLHPLVQITESMALLFISWLASWSWWLGKLLLDDRLLRMNLVVEKLRRQLSTVVNLYLL